MNYDTACVMIDKCRMRNAGTTALKRLSDFYLRIHLERRARTFRD